MQIKHECLHNPFPFFYHPEERDREVAFCKVRFINIRPAFIILLEWLFSVTIGEINTRSLTRTVEVVTIIAITYCEVPWRLTHITHSVCEESKTEKTGNRRRAA